MHKSLALAAMLAITPIAVRAEEPVEIKAGPGKEVVEANCAVCHSLDYIRTNATFLSPDGWKAEVAKMRGPFGAPIDPSSVDEILSYLTANYGVPAKI